MTGPAAVAVLFDMDGLLIDSEPLWTVAEVELAHQLGGEWSDGIKTAIIGTRLDVAVPSAAHSENHRPQHQQEMT